MNKVSYGERIPGKEKYSSLEAHVEIECEPGDEEATLEKAQRVVRDILAADPPNVLPLNPVTPPCQWIPWRAGTVIERSSVVNWICAERNNVERFLVSGYIVQEPDCFEGYDPERGFDPAVWRVIE